MKDLKSLVKKYWYSAAILLLFLIAVFLRVYRLESLPDVLHIDEAGLGYNAWCLAHYGTDRYLNVRPFYPQNFYGGQSPLYTYLLALLIRTVGQGNLSLTLLKIPAVLASLLLFLSGPRVSVWCSMIKNGVLLLLSCWQSAPIISCPPVLPWTVILCCAAQL